MKNFVSISLYLILSMCSATAHAQAWTTQADMKLKRSEATAIEHQGQLYVFNGFSQGLHVGNSIEKYNPTNKQWSLLGSTTTLNGTAVTHSGVVPVGDELWIIGGRVGAHPGPVSNQVWKYHVTSKSWRVGPALPRPMAGGGAALVNNKIYVFGGMDAQAKCDVDYHYVYDLAKPDSGWNNITSSARMPTARNHFSTVAIDNIIYAIGGQHGHDGCAGSSGEDLALVHSYNPQTNQWQRLADLPAIESHNEPSTFAHNGFIYTVGGATAGDKVLRMDPAKNQWEHIATLPEPLLAPVARIYDGRLVVAGGGAPITAKSKTTVRSIGLQAFHDTAINFAGTNTTNTNTNTSNSNSAGSTANNGDQIVISVEAEAFNARTGTATHQWVSSSLPQASGADSMKTTPNTGILKPNANGSPMLSYNLTFSEPGSYHLWVRGWGDENASGVGSNDSLHAGLNGALVSSADKIDGFKSGWNWSKRTRDGAPAVLQIPSAGVHTVNLWMREDGFAVDQFLLVNDASYVPQGVTPSSTQTTGNTTVTIANLAPLVSAGANGSTLLGSVYSTQAQVSDDGLPNGVVNLLWSKVSGPGNVDIDQPTSLATDISFSETGTYVLKLQATDGALSDSDNVSVVVQRATPNSGSSTGGQSVTGVIAIEAENYQNKTGAASQQWANATYANSSGGKSMIATPNKGALKHSAANSPKLSYSVSFASAGTYYVWIRGWGDEQSNGKGGNDSVHAGLNNTLSASADKIDGFPSGWNWSNRTRDGAPATLNVPSTGTHTFNLWMREDGFAVDKIILAKAASFTPSGHGISSTQTSTAPTVANSAPLVNVGPNTSIMANATVNLNGVVSDDSLAVASLQISWSRVSGPGAVAFANASNVSTTASFDVAGSYVLKLTASDGALTGSDTLSVVVNAVQTNTTTAQTGSATVAVEAEDYLIKSAAGPHQWVAANFSGASGNGSMVTTPNTGVLKNSSAGSPMMSYPVNFPEAGTYHLWVRGWGDEQPNGAGTNDSIHAGLNGVISSTADKIDGFSAGWHWSNRTRDGLSARLTVPGAGIHTVNFWMREDGFAIDKFIVSKDASFVPAGVGGIASVSTNTGSNNSQPTASNTGNSSSTGSSGFVANANRAWKLVQTVNGSSVVARHEAGAVAVSNNTFYVMGGRGQRPVQSFSEAANRWTSHGVAPVLMNHFQPVVLGNKVYVIGALKDDNYPSEQPLENVYVFDTLSHTWTKGASVPESRRRGSVGAAVHEGKIYLVGGNTRGHSGPAVNWFDEFDPATSQWRVMPNAPHARDHATIAVAGGKLVVAGGRRTAHPNVWGDTEAKTDVFDFATGQWQNTAEDIPTKRAGTMAVAVGDEIVIIGGETLGAAIAHRDVEAFNVSTGKWRSLQPLLEGRHSGGAVVLGDKIHVISGNSTRGGGSESINHETLRLDVQP